MTQDDTDRRMPENLPDIYVKSVCQHQHKTETVDYCNPGLDLDAFLRMWVKFLVHNKTTSGCR